MAFGKWIGGWLGWINSQSILGALAGFALGSIFDIFTDSGSRPRQNTNGQYDDDDGEAYGEAGKAAAGERNGFLFSLMVLAAHIIQADGRIMHSEMELVRRFLRMSFGEEAAEEGNSILMNLFDYRKRNGDALWRRQIHEACHEMSRHMTPEHRMQLLAFLCEIAKADGTTDTRESDALKAVAADLDLDPQLIDQMLHLGGESIDDAYAVLGITEDATDDEVRKAYRQMAIKHHPDRVATLGDDVKAAATKKFQDINNAKELIFKARGMK